MKYIYYFKGQFITPDTPCCGVPAKVTWERVQGELGEPPLWVVIELSCPNPEHNPGAALMRIAGKES